jgi:hypothetical protein
LCTQRMPDNADDSVIVDHHRQTCVVCATP